MTKNWWQEVVVYQIYPRSFKDSNGDGIGDIQGIIEKLDYLQKLGIGAIWLSPVYQSPNDDNGYDISDYQAIMQEFGEMADMEIFISEANKRDIRIVMDLVVNHTSDEHNWFIEAKKGRDNPYRDYYVWSDPGVDGGVPNNLTSTFSGPAWELDEASGQYYFHLFSKKQPDLNWENPQVRQAVYDMMNFWIAKGIGGFRMDVIDLIGKVPLEGITGNGPKLHQYLQEMNQKTFGAYDLLTVGETWGATPELAKLYSDPKRNELSMVFQFEHVSLDQQPGKDKWDLYPLDVGELKKVLTKWQVKLGNDGWNSLFWNNHDLPRIISRWGNDQEYREESGKLLAILLHMMRGTPYIYQGEEIGMINTPINDIAEAEDIESINMYHERLEAGFDSKDILASINAKGRDNARRPMAWDNSDQGGFTTGTPWLELNENYETINVAAALADPNSLFYTYQQLIQLRKEYPLMVWGEFELLDTAEQVFSFYRTYQDQRWLIITNFSNEEQVFSCEDKIEELIIQNYRCPINQLSNIKLRPWQALVFKVKNEVARLSSNEEKKL
ncbi:glycoside hydrolase family 13 protein [Enterococcus pallens]|uniref:Glucan 1,6-alpha-glucosidase n=1 Tax=Enterococcus pallens ATCC BAA-351 TaxID=1158607 RepID=R2QM85_9ENTE|nr:alpha-glucosidase [Enterococcus pallens]EOH97682.1 glucan 1,6-alpha-glucosidase [Enterococcus pallens ATCC BAA-351]EOU20899.1 glucan 1,6-alpha-glucosidase [Enterococcus pallens ATCC BAA-351]OJG80222.1 glucan 1,6-alpha-glucosidase [Enterococcus pallens]